jgi:diguanylate cyclase (GGDEF)-like protein/PAS domain S-box-containing protein
MSIGRKLLVIGLATTGFALLSFSLLSIGKGVLEWRTRTVSDLTTYAQILGTNAAPAMLFNDRQSATDTLSALSATPNIVFGAVYDKEGKLFATYGKPSEGPKSLSMSPGKVDFTFSSEDLTLLNPIVFQSERMGTIYLKTNLQQLYSGIATDSLITIVAAIAAFSLAAFLFFRLQARIVNPIVGLSTAMREIAKSRNYKVRVTPQTADEVGVLAETFNGMLEAVEERDAKLAEHQAQLEEAVKQRTGQLKQTNTLLQRELTDRKKAQDALHAHDAMLKAVAHSATELLSSLNIDEAISSVLELIGQTLAVTRVQIAVTSIGKAGHLHSTVRYEWCTPGMISLIDQPISRDLDLTASFPRTVSSTIVGEQSTLTLNEFPEEMRKEAEKAGIRSMLIVPIMAERKLWGTLLFMDSSDEIRSWNWAETDTLSTLAGLIAASTMRARYVKELADANTIVQNSPTVLYRIKGEPTLPLTYVSHNITKFGYDPKKLVTTGSFFQTLVHPDDRNKVLEAMANIVEKDAKAATIEFRLMLPSGSYRWVENRYTPVRDDTGRLIEIEGIIIDITERKAAEEKISQLARTDSLTGLANRATFTERLHQAYSSAKRGASPFAVLYLDLDHFKDVNDTRGHPVGDALLREVSERLKTLVRETDLVARLGGDEFAVIQTEITDPSDAGALANKICESLRATYYINGNDLHVSASVGIAPYTADTVSSDALLSQADLALYRAKEDGRNLYRFHSEELDLQVSERVTLAAELRNALDRGEIEVYYQPQVELINGRIVGMEALVRWHHPKQGILSPAAFIPVAEKTGIIGDLGHYVLETACQQMKKWREQDVAPSVIAINISMLQLKMGNEFIRDVTQTLERAGLLPQFLEIDVTESMVAQATLAQNKVLERLQQLGVRIALDNFGMEYSSFDYLRTYRVNHLKVAQEFIRRAIDDPKGAATVRAIIGAARELGIQVIAEGVETEEQRALLVSIGSSTSGQGFFFSEAVPADKATLLLQKGSIETAEDTSMAKAAAGDR